jgi:hypothetical protein
MFDRGRGTLIDWGLLPNRQEPLRYGAADLSAARLLFPHGRLTSIESQY